MHEKGFIKEIRHDGKIALSLQPVGAALADSLQELIMQRLEAEGGMLPVCDKSDPAVISKLFNVSKGNFKKAIGALFKQGRIVIHDDRIERA
jgi:predicted RNA-binding protein (virulence factor B family)